MATHILLQIICKHLKSVLFKEKKKQIYKSWFCVFQRKILFEKGIFIPLYYYFQNIFRAPHLEWPFVPEAYSFELP